MLNLADVTNSAHIYLAAKDTHLRYVYCNENLARAIGLDSPQSIVGLMDKDLYDDRFASVFTAGDYHILAGGTLINVEEQLPVVGRTMQILTSKNSLKTKDGEVNGIVISFLDITGLSIKPPAELMQYDSRINKYTMLIDDKVEYFSKKEYLIFKHLLRGLTSKQIAKLLFLSFRTVEDYIEKIKLKFQCASKHQIIEAAMRLGILQLNMKI